MIRLYAIRWSIADILRTVASTLDGGMSFVLRRPPDAIIGEEVLEKCMALVLRQASELLRDEVTAARVEETMRAVLPGLYEDERTD